MPNKIPHHPLHKGKIQLKPTPAGLKKLPSVPLTLVQVQDSNRSSSRRWSSGRKQGGLEGRCVERWDSQVMGRGQKVHRNMNRNRGEVGNRRCLSLVLQLLVEELSDLDDRRRRAEWRPAPTGGGSHRLDLTSANARGERERGHSASYSSISIIQHNTRTETTWSQMLAYFNFLDVLVEDRKWTTCY